MKTIRIDNVRTAFANLFTPDKYKKYSIQLEIGGADIGRVQELIDQTCRELGWEHGDMQYPLYSMEEYKGTPRLVLRPKTAIDGKVQPRIYVGDEASPVSEDPGIKNGARADVILGAHSYDKGGNKGVTLKPLAIRFHTLEPTGSAPDEEHLRELLFGDNAEGGF